MIIVLVGWCARLPLENLANSPNSSEGGGRDFLLPPKNATHSEPPPLSPPQAPNILGYFRKTKKSLWGGSLWTNRSTSLVSNDFTKQVYKSWCCYWQSWYYLVLRYMSHLLLKVPYAFRSVLSCAPWMSENHECPLQRVYNSCHKHTECDEEFGEEFCYEQKFFSRFNNATYLDWFQEVIYRYVQ